MRARCLLGLVLALGALATVADAEDRTAITQHRAGVDPLFLAAEKQTHFGDSKGGGLSLGVGSQCSAIELFGFNRKLIRDDCNGHSSFRSNFLGLTAHSSKNWTPISNVKDSELRLFGKIPIIGFSHSKLDAACCGEKKMQGRIFGLALPAITLRSHRHVVVPLAAPKLMPLPPEPAPVPRLE